MESKYIQMELIERKPKTYVFEVQTKNDQTRLGQISWFGRWRQYVFFPEPETVFSSGCMADINSFIEHLMADHKEILQGVKIEYH